MWVTAKECVGITGLPGLVHNIRNNLDRFADKKTGCKRVRSGTKTFEYSIDCFPVHIRDQLLARQVRQDAPAVIEEKTSHLTRREVLIARREINQAHPEAALAAAGQITDKQKQIADARSSLCQLIARLIADGMTRKNAITLVCNASRTGELSPEMQEAADRANARKGITRRGVSVPRLQEWYTTWQHTNGNPAELMAMLAPSQRSAQPWETIPWLPDFLLYYRTWKRPSICAAYRDWVDALAGQPDRLAILPALDRVEKTLRRVPVLVRERFRVTGSAWRSLNPFVRREWNTLPVNAVWVGDGHCMKVVCFNPATGNLFRPEVTFIMDAGQRFIVGWSLALSENTRAVADALRWSMTRHGIPLIYYSDNGGGQTNRQLDANITGILPRLGVEHMTGIAGNPQGRGNIERLNRSVPDDIARSFETYCSQHADREKVNLQQRLMRSALNAVHQGKDLTPRQVQAIGQVPTWEQMLKAIEDEVRRYNLRPHEALPRAPSGRHYSPLEYRRFLMAEAGREESTDLLTPAEAHEFFMPEKVCHCSRGEVRLFNNLYFSQALAPHHDENLRVAYDIHDPQTVVVRDRQGRFICEAVWNGNRTDAVAKPVIEHLQEKRAKGRMKRLNDKAAEVARELTPAIEAKADEVWFDGEALLAARQADAVPLQDEPQAQPDGPTPDDMVDAWLERQYHRLHG